MVIPAELFQVNYAAETRKFLSDFFSQLTIITFEQLVFKGIQQEVVLLLGEHTAPENGSIRVIELGSMHDLTAFLNSLTFAFAEVTGRSYGGGVLTFEPGEAERLPLPLTGADELDLEYIDRKIRADDIETVLDLTDKVLLLKGLGLSSQQSKMLRNIWKKLRDRRIHRNRKHKRKNDSYVIRD